MIWDWSQSSICQHWQCFINMKIWKCKYENVSMRVWKYKCENMNIKVWKCEYESMTMWI